MKITPFLRIKLEKCIYKITLMMIKGRAIFSGSFDKQCVDFTFLFLLPMKWMNKNKIR